MLCRKRWQICSSLGAVFEHAFAVFYVLTCVLLWGPGWSWTQSSFASITLCSQVSMDNSFSEMLLLTLQCPCCRRCRGPGDLDLSATLDVRRAVCVWEPNGEMLLSSIFTLSGTAIAMGWICAGLQLKEVRNASSHWAFFLSKAHRAACCRILGSLDHVPITHPWGCRNCVTFPGILNMLAKRKMWQEPCRSALTGALHTGSWNCWPCH